MLTMLVENLCGTREVQQSIAPAKHIVNELADILGAMGVHPDDRLVAVMNRLKPSPAEERKRMFTEIVNMAPKV